MLRVRQGVLGYSDKTIISGLSMQLAPETRLGLLGPNGAGKSTLIKSLAGALEPQGGEWFCSEHAKIGYFAQHQLDQLDMQATPLLELQRIAGRTEEIALRNYLGSFGFHGDDVNTRIDRFSGGEKSRLALALIVWQKPNVLLLDEPTNHLDLEMRHALTVALQDYEGALVLVSHDRSLLKNVCDEFWLVADQRAQVFSGNMDDYTRWLADYRARQLASDMQNKGNDAAGTDGKGGDRKLDRKQAADRREKLKPFKQKIDTLEKKLAQAQQKKLTIDQQLADPDIYASSSKEILTELLKTQARVQGEINAIENDWFEACDAMEQAGQGL